MKMLSLTSLIFFTLYITLHIVSFAIIFVCFHLLHYALFHFPLFSLVSIVTVVFRWILICGINVMILFLLLYTESNNKCC